MSEETKNPLEDKIGQALMINGIIAAMPQIVEFYPQIESLITKGENKLEEFMDEEKMVVLSKKNGRIFAIILDKKVQFTIDNNFDIEANNGTNPVIKTFEKNEWKDKLQNNAIMQTLKERFEKLNPDRVVNNSPEDILSSIVESIPK